MSHFPIRTVWLFLFVLAVSCNADEPADENPRFRVDAYALAPRIFSGHQYASEFDVDLHGTKADMRDDFGLGGQMWEGVLEARLRFTDDDAVAMSAWWMEGSGKGTFSRDIIFNERIWHAGQRFTSSFHWWGYAVQYERRLVNVSGFSFFAGAGIEYDDSYTIIHIQEPVLTGGSKGEGGKAWSPRFVARAEQRLPAGFSVALDLVQTAPIPLIHDNKGLISMATLQVRWSPVRWVEVGIGLRMSRTDLHLNGWEADRDKADNRMVFFAEAPFLAVSVRF